MALPSSFYSADPLIDTLSGSGSVTVDQAGAADLRRTSVTPFEAPTFRNQSVTVDQVGAADLRRTSVTPFEAPTFRNQAQKSGRASRQVSEYQNR